MGLKKIIFLIPFFIFVFSPLAIAVTEQECQSKQQTEVSQGVACWEQLLGEVGQRKVTLQSEIIRFNTAISLTLAKIDQTAKQIKVLETEIAGLTTQIIRLDVSLNQLSEILIKRIGATYKKGKIEPLTLLFSSVDFSEFVARYKYLRVMQIHDRKLMVQMENVRTNYEDQKTLKEQKQDELEKAKKKLESQKVLLAQQKADKENLLRITQNDEKRFQNLLAQARAELVAIKGILAGQGKELKIGFVSEGQKIASLITGDSCNSSGTHLHFMVAKGSETNNPFSYLKDNVEFTNCSGSSCGSGDGDSFNPSGSWNWPINSPLKFNQGYGYTWAIQHTWLGRIYNFHNGIDITGNSLEVKAVKAGILYQGVFEGSCRLAYVRVDHDDSDLETYYLHVNY